MFKVTFNDLVIIAMEIHLFPCRTQKLSPSTAEVLGGCPLGDRRVAKFWEFSSAGRASALQAEGQRFDPVNSHLSGCSLVVKLQPSKLLSRVRFSSPALNLFIKFIPKIFGRIAQLVRAHA